MVREYEGLFDALVFLQVYRSLFCLAFTVTGCAVGIADGDTLPS
jgi:hypothetical protein